MDPEVRVNAVERSAVGLHAGVEGARPEAASAVAGAVVEPLAREVDAVPHDGLYCAGHRVEEADEVPEGEDHAAAAAQGETAGHLRQLPDVCLRLAGRLGVELPRRDVVPIEDAVVRRPDGDLAEVACDVADEADRDGHSSCPRSEGVPGGK